MWTTIGIVLFALGLLLSIALHEAGRLSISTATASPLNRQIRWRTRRPEELRQFISGPLTHGQCHPGAPGAIERAGRGSLH